MNRREFHDTGVVYPHWDNQLSKAVPFLNLAMSIYSRFRGSVVVSWTLDKRIRPHPQQRNAAAEAC